LIHQTAGGFTASGGSLLRCGGSRRACPADVHPSSATRKPPPTHR